MRWKCGYLFLFKNLILDKYYYLLGKENGENITENTHTTKNHPAKTRKGISC